MIKTLKNYFHQHILSSSVKEKKVVEAYDLWAENYDAQPGNLMLDLDEILFSKILETVEIEDKNVADIGCGTGRHWAKIFEKKPLSLTGFDVSPGMLNKLKIKYPAANLEVITNNSFVNIPDYSYDIILSTLTVAHIENIEEALLSWRRILKEDGEIIITDFHPDILAIGGQRTFKHKNGHIAVQNFVHSTSTISGILLTNGFSLAAVEERRIDEKVMHYYEEQNAMHVYEKFKGLPVIYGMRFRRTG